MVSGICSMADFVQYVVHDSRPHINQYILDDTDWWPLQGHVATLVVGGLRISCPCHEKPKKALAGLQLQNLSKLITPLSFDMTPLPFPCFRSAAFPSLLCPQLQVLLNVIIQPSSLSSVPQSLPVHRGMVYFPISRLAQLSVDTSRSVR